MPADSASPSSPRGGEPQARAWDALLGLLHPDEPRLHVERPLEQAGLALGVPDFDPRVGPRMHGELHVAAVQRRFDRADALRVRAIETVGHAQDAGERADQPAIAPLEPRKRTVALFRECLAVITRHARDDLELALREALEVAVQDEMVGVLVMLRVIDH